MTRTIPLRVRWDHDQVEDRRKAWAAFERNFEALAALIGEAQFYGPMPNLERRYRDLTRGLVRQYGPLRPYMACYLLSLAEDHEWGMGQAGYSTDAFEALVVAPSLSGLLEEDPGRLAARICRVREAIARYGDHLRWLAASGT